MAHEITVENGIAEMAYAGDAPWHKLGQKMNPNATLEEWAINAGMNWVIEKKDIFYTDTQTGNQITIPNKTLLVRSDNGKALSVMGKRYNEVQPSQVLEFFKDLIDSQGFKMETAGTLFGGRKFWALAKTGLGFNVGSEDEIGGYLLISTSCDGTIATIAKFTSICVVCNNTLTIANAKGGRAKITRHSSYFDPKKIKENLEVYQGNFETFKNNVCRLSDYKVGETMAINFCEEVADRMYVSRKDWAVSKLFTLYSHESMGNKLISRKNTAWGLVNAVTEFVDHHQKKRSLDASVQNSLFGRGDIVKSFAFEKALKLVA